MSELSLWFLFPRKSRVGRLVNSRVVTLGLESRSEVPTTALFFLCSFLSRRRGSFLQKNHLMELSQVVSQEVFEW